MKRIFCASFVLLAITTFAAPMKPLASLFDKKNQADFETGLVRCVAVLSAAAQAALENDGDAGINQDASNIIASRANYFVDKIFEQRGIKTKDSAALARTEIYDLIKMPAMAYQNQNRTAIGKKLSMADSKLCMEIAAPAFTASPVSVATAAPDPFSYYLQLAAPNDAREAERILADLTKRGIEAKITEREQSGRTTYLVRSGPYKSRDEVSNAKTKFFAEGFEDVMVVRVQK